MVLAYLRLQTRYTVRRKSTEALVSVIVPLSMSQSTDHQFSKFKVQTTLSSDGRRVQRVVQKRKRQPVSCTPCRTRRSRCDRGRPCTTCTQRGLSPITCTYAVSDEGRSQSSKTTTSSHNDVEGQAHQRLQHLESLVLELMHKPSVLSAETSVSESASNNSYLAPKASGELFQPGAQGHSTADSGQAHWSTILVSIHKLKSASSAADVSDTPVRTTTDTASHEPMITDFTAAKAATVLLGPTTLLSLPQILHQYLPSRAKIDRRLSVYFNAKYVVIPIIHSMHFQKDYENFWATPAAASPAWVSMLFSILCLSATVSASNGTETDPAAKDDFIRGASACLTLEGYMLPKQYVIEALLLLAQCKYIGSLDPSREVALILSIVTRLAFQAGLHREPDSTVSAFQGEMQRRVWVMVKHFDVQISSQLGVPANIPAGSHDTRAPHNLLDTDFAEDTIHLPLERDEAEITPSK